MNNIRCRSSPLRPIHRAGSCAQPASQASLLRGAARLRAPAFAAPADSLIKAVKFDDVDRP